MQKRNVQVKYFIDSLKQKNIHIVGICGAETSAIARYLHSAGCGKLTLHDFNSLKEFENIFNISHVSYPKKERQAILAETLNIPAVKRFKNEYLKDIMTADVIFVSQNWFNYRFNKPALVTAKSKGIPFYTITELYFQLIKAKIIGVTGTNGKTTTANLIRHILEKSVESAGKRVFFAGNDRYSRQILDKADDITEDDAVVLEISNRQLVPLQASPHVAVITNIARDHIEEHGSFENYVDVKYKIFAFQKSDDFAVINYDDEIARSFANKIKSKVFFYSLNERSGKNFKNGAFVKNSAMYSIIDGNQNRLAKIDELKTRGMHNVSNALAASLAALVYGGATPDDVSAALKDFTGVKSRLEFVRKVSGVSFYNDISSTSPHATIAAVKSFTAPVILIAGGMDKEMDFAELCGVINKTVKSVILLPGSATDKMTTLLDSFETADTLKAAVEKAYEIAKKGDSVVLSPAAANFFTLYASGKNGFNRLVKRIKKKCI